MLRPVPEILGIIPLRFASEWSHTAFPFHFRIPTNESPIDTRSTRPSFAGAFIAWCRALLVSLPPGARTIAGCTELTERLSLSCPRSSQRRQPLPLEVTDQTGHTARHRHKPAHRIRQNQNSPPHRMPAFAANPSDGAQAE